MPDPKPTEPGDAVMARYLTPEIMAELVETTKAGQRWARAHPAAAARLKALMGEMSTMTEALPADFALTIRTARATQGLGLRQTARAAGVSASYISDLEHGLRPPPSTRVVRALATLLVLDEAALLEQALAGRHEIILSVEHYGRGSAQWRMIVALQRQWDAGQLSAETARHILEALEGKA